MRELCLFFLLMMGMLATASAQESTNRIQVFLTDSKLARYTDYVGEITSKDTKKLIIRISNNQTYKSADDDGIILEVQTKDVAKTLPMIKEVLRRRGFPKAKILSNRSPAEGRD